MARPLLDPLDSPPPARLWRPLRVPPLCCCRSRLPRLPRSRSLSHSLPASYFLSSIFFETVAKNITLKGVGRTGQGRAVHEGGRPASATDVFLIRFLICGQSNCNWFVIVSRLRCETSGDFFCIVCPGYTLPPASCPLPLPSSSPLPVLSCCGKYLSFIVIALVRSIVVVPPPPPPLPTPPSPAAPLIRPGDLSPPHLPSGLLAALLVAS